MFPNILYHIGRQRVRQASRDPPYAFSGTPSDHGIRIRQRSEQQRQQPLDILGHVKVIGVRHGVSADCGVRVSAGSRDTDTSLCQVIQQGTLTYIAVTKRRNTMSFSSTETLHL